MQYSDVGPVRLSAEEIAAAVENLAAAAEARYVDPAGGSRIAAALRTNLAEGRYAALADPLELAAQLSNDLYAAVPDVHLRVAYEPNRSAETMAVNAGSQSPSAAQPFARNDQRSTAAIARTNYGFDALERLDGNVGYLKMSRFVPPEMSEPTARAAMEFLAHSDAIIIDLRGNIGGSPELVRYLLSHFTASGSQPLMTRYTRESDQTETMLSLDDIPGRRRAGTALHVLIDRNTASAAEMFAYLVQQNGLGMVYGETSRGAGQGGSMLPVGSGLSAFLPFTRIVDGPGWEQTGVTPDVAVAPDHAIQAVQLAAIEALLAATTDAAHRRELEWTHEMIAPSPALGEHPTDLGRFAGEFGRLTFAARDGALYLTGSAGREEALKRVDETSFRTRTARYSFAATPASPAVAVTLETIGGVRSILERSGTSLTSL